MQRTRIHYPKMERTWRDVCLVGPQITAFQLKLHRLDTRWLWSAASNWFLNLLLLLPLRSRHVTPHLVCARFIPNLLQHIFPSSLKMCEDGTHDAQPAQQQSGLNTVSMLTGCQHSAASKDTYIYIYRWSSVCVQCSTNNKIFSLPTYCEHQNKKPFKETWVCMQRALLTSAGDTPCGCTVPFLHPSRRAHWPAPPRLLHHPSHSYWPLPPHTVGQLGTGRARKEIKFAMANQFYFNHIIQRALQSINQVISLSL